MMTIQKILPWSLFCAFVMLSGHGAFAVPPACRTVVQLKSEPTHSQIQRFLRLSQKYTESLPLETYSQLVEFTIKPTVNEILRGMRGKKTRDAQFNRELQLIDTAIEEAPEAPPNMALYRGIKIDSSKPGIKKLVGDVGSFFVSKSYVSTTSSTKIARNYGAASGTLPDAVIYKVVPKPGRSLRALNLNISGNPNNYEKEFILPRGSKFKVVSKEVYEIKKWGILYGRKFLITLELQDP